MMTDMEFLTAIKKLSPEKRKIVLDRLKEMVESNQKKGVENNKD